MKADLGIKRFDRRILAGVIALTGAAAMLFGVAAENAQAAKGKDIRVMTRNIFLGADLGLPPFARAAAAATCKSISLANKASQLERS